MARNADRSLGTVYEHVLGVTVEQERARYGAWYELFPAPAPTEPGSHGTFKDCEKRLSYVAGMGFDVLYLPPIHPIGVSFRKGPNNTLNAGPDDPGSPWAIGAAEGGHKAIHPDLGTLSRLRPPRRRGARARASTSRWTSLSSVRPTILTSASIPNGSVTARTARSNTPKIPPKKYQDIYPLDFECADWQGAVERTAQRGRSSGRNTACASSAWTTRTRSRSDFWEWLIAQVRERYPDAVFLSEAFTRPKVMRRLAKMGFSQSYTYFTWRNTGPEIIAYFTELTQTSVREYMRPNLFANTPDILPEFLWQQGVERLPFSPRAGRDAGRNLRHLRAAVRELRIARRPARVRSISTRKSIRYATGTGSGRTSSASSSPASTAFAGRTRRFTTTTACASIRPTTKT